MPARRMVMIVAAALALGAAAGGQVSGQAETLLQKAIQAETVDGNLKAAIGLYEQAVAAAGSNRPVAARALVQMGQCYEKLGSAEARKAYQRVVRDFGDQAEPLKAARTRLAALVKATEAGAAAPRFRRLEIPGKPSMNSAAMLSPDGTRFAFVAEGSIWTVPVSGGVHPDIAGEAVRLTKDMRAWEAGNCTVAWSTDGQWIAFRVRPDHSVYLVPASGGEPRRVDGIGPAPGGAQSMRISVSQSGKRIVFAAGPELSPSLFMIPGEGGRPSRLVPEIALEPAFSPNGRLVAYVKGERTAGGRLASIMVVAADGAEPVLVSSLPVDASTDSPTWSPDGRMIAFPVAAEDSGALWIVPVSSGGKPEAEPTKIDLKPIVTATLHGKSVRKFMDPLGGWSHKNEIALLLESPEDSAIYRVPVAGGRATLIGLEGREPRWSPDGKRVYFRGKTNIESVAAEGGDERPVPIGYKIPLTVWFPSGSNEVSRDGKSIVFAGGYHKSEQHPGLSGIFIVPSEGGEARQIAVPGDGVPLNPSWSPDGKWLAYTNTNSIWIVASEGGSPRQLTTAADQVAENELRWSPDGKTIAYFGADKTLRLTAVTVGPSQVLTRIPLANYFLGLSWSPDGSKLAYTTIEKAWIISASGGEPREIPVGFEGRMTQIDWSPDGRNLVFMGATGGEEEVWLMSDFLHLVKAVR